MRIRDLISDVCSSDLDVSRDRDHQGRGAELLRADRAGPAAASRRPCGDPDPVATRRTGQVLLREERPLRGAVVVAKRPGADDRVARILAQRRSEEHTSELQSLMRISYAVFCLKKKKN